MAAARPPHVPGVLITPTQVPDSPAERQRLVRELMSGVGKLLLEAAKHAPPHEAGLPSQEPEKGAA